MLYLLMLRKNIMVNWRKKWNNYEVLIAKELRELGFKDCITSRCWSKATDDLGIDLLHTSPWLVQCKNYKSFPASKIIDSLQYIENSKKSSKLVDSQDIAIVCTKITHKGEIISMSKKDFYRIVKILKQNKIK